MAVSADGVADARRTAESLSLPFPLLSDPELALAKALGAVHAGAAPGGGDLFRPATFVVGQDGIVRWISWEGGIRERPDPAELLRAVRAARGT